MLHCLLIGPFNCYLNVITSSIEQWNVPDEAANFAACYAILVSRNRSPGSIKGALAYACVGMRGQADEPKESYVIDGTVESDNWAKLIQTINTFAGHISATQYQSCSRGLAGRRIYVIETAILDSVSD